MIHVLAKITVAPGKRSEFLAKFRALVPQVRAEAGCIEYGPTVDAPTSIGIQERLGDDTVMVVEKWESLATLEAHLAAPHMAEYRESVKDIVLELTARILEPV